MHVRVKINDAPVAEKIDAKYAMTLIYPKVVYVCPHITNWIIVFSIPMKRVAVIAETDITLIQRKNARKLTSKIVFKLM